MIDLVIKNQNKIKLILIAVSAQSFQTTMISKQKVK